MCIRSSIILNTCENTGRGMKEVLKPSERQMNRRCKSWYLQEERSPWLWVEDFSSLPVQPPSSPQERL